MQSMTTGIQDRGGILGSRDFGPWPFEFRKLVRDTLELLDGEGLARDEAAKVISGFLAEVRRRGYPTADPIRILMIRAWDYCRHSERVAKVVRGLRNCAVEGRQSHHGFP